MHGTSGRWEHGGTSSEGATVACLPFFVDLPVSAFISLFFLGFYVLQPQQAGCIGCLLYNIKRGKTLYLNVRCALVVQFELLRRLTFRNRRSIKL